MTIKNKKQNTKLSLHQQQRENAQLPSDGGSCYQNIFPITNMHYKPLKRNPSCLRSVAIIHVRLQDFWVMKPFKRSRNSHCFHTVACLGCRGVKLPCKALTWVLISTNNLQATHMMDPNKWSFFFFFYTLTVDKSLAQSWVVFKVRALWCLWNVADAHRRCATTAPLLCLAEAQTEVTFSSKCHKKIRSAVPGVTLHRCSCCITPRGYEFIQCFSIWHPVHQEISQAERATSTL